MQAANALKNKRLRDKKKKVPFTKPDLSKVTSIKTEGEEKESNNL